MIENLDTFSEKRNLIYSKTNTKEDMEEKLLQAGYRTEETLLIAAEDATLQNGREIGLATIAFVNQKKNGQTYSAADIVVEGFEEVDFYFLERIYQRKHGIPWRVIETERTYLREMTVEDVDALYEIYAQEGMTDFIEPLCEICGQDPCHPRCPNAPEPKEVHICSECLEGIYPGDRFYESCGSYVCEECLKGMTIDEIFELLGESLEEA